MPLDSSGISKKISENKEKVLGFGVKRLGLFGSFARNQQRRASDVDILVEFQKGKKNLDNFMDLADYLEKILRKKVDLLTPEALTPPMKRRILGEVKYFRL